jgi:hypothetical protein
MLEVPHDLLYRATIGDGNALAVEVGLFHRTCSALRPRQAAGERTPRAALPRRRTLRLACGLGRTRYVTGRS